MAIVMDRLTEFGFSINSGKLHSVRGAPIHSLGTPGITQWSFPEPKNWIPLTNPSLQLFVQALFLVRDKSLDHSSY